jgi:competence protein ComEA
MRRSAIGLAALAALCAVGGWMERRPPAWLDADPLLNPFGLAPPTAADSSGLRPVVSQVEWSAANPLPLADATAADLAALPGVGPVLAARILARRDSLGGIDSAAELDAVVGIGPKLLSRLLPLLRFAPAANESLLRR